MMKRTPLIDEYPMLVLPTLAVKIGLNEAIFLQQLHFWLQGKSHKHDGKMWIYNTYESWAEQFPFWSVRTIRRIVTSLKDSDLIETTDKYNKMPMDNTLWYTIVYSNLPEWTDHVANLATPHVDNMATPITIDYTETTAVVEAAATTAAVRSPWVGIFEHAWGRLVASPYEKEMILDWEGRVPVEAWEYALAESAKANARNWKYLERILKRLEVEGYVESEASSEPSEPTTVYIRSRETGELVEKRVT